MATLTKRQKQIYDFIKSYITKNGISPTFEEIKKHLRLKALSTISEHIEELVEKGFILKNGYGSRSIEIAENKETRDIPLCGLIAAGEPIEAIREYEKISVPKNLLPNYGDFFALQVKGKSMIEEGIFDGDHVIIKKQSTAENGDTVVAIINGNEATLKKIYKIQGGFKLQPANSELKPFTVREIIVQGKVISVMRNYQNKRYINKTANVYSFTSELRNLADDLKSEMTGQFKPGKEFDEWKKTEGRPDVEKFIIETVYTTLNELILLWICRDKKLLHFETIRDFSEYKNLQKEAQKIYSHLFEDNIFDWHSPSNLFFYKITNLFNGFEFSEIDRDILGKLYEQFINKEERKRLGQFYTPEPVIDYILDQSGYINNIENKTIIDISCGSGGFMTRAANRLISKLKNNPNKESLIEKVINNIYGLDINPFACYLAETNILIQLLDIIVEVKNENPKYKVPKIKIFQTNTMEMPSLLSTEDKEIIDIKNRADKFSGGFDFVVGNPPYLEAKKMDKETKGMCALSCPDVATGAFDLFVCFIDKGLGLLKSSGKIGYIFPNKFLIAGYAKKMREKLLNDYSIKEIIDVSECEVFEGVSVYPVILIAENKKPSNNIIKTADKVTSTEELSNKKFITSEIRQDIYKRDDFVFFIMPSDKRKSSILTKLLSKKYAFLENYLSMKWTISFHASGLREKFLFPERPRSNFAKKLIGGKSFAGNSDIGRYKLNWGGWWIDYDEERARKHKNQLPPKKLFEREKLIICQNSLRLRATFDKDNFYCKDTFFVATLNDQSRNNFDLKFFLALLNSKLFHFYYANIYKGTHIAGGYLHYLISYLYSLPVAEPTKKQQSEIVALVEKILKVKEEKEFNKIDNQIDNLIYKLYGLEKNEIEIIENFI